MPTLHCPTCGYNLTGLPENRCPECGDAFDPRALARELERKSLPREAPPIGTGGAWARIMLLPACFWVWVGLAALFNVEQPLGLAFLVAGGQVLGGIFYARHLAERMASWRAMREHRDVNQERDRWFIIGWSVTLYVTQVMASVGGVIVLSGLMMWMSYP